MSRWGVVRSEPHMVGRWPATGHGTAARFRADQKAGRKPCKLCRLAMNAYRNSRRTETGLERQALEARVRQRAYQRLAARHRSEFLTLTYEIRQALEKSA